MFFLFKARKDNYFSIEYNIILCKRACPRNKFPVISSEVKKSFYLCSPKEQN